MTSENRKKHWTEINFELLEKKLNGRSRSSLSRIRRQAFSRLSQLGFPTTGDEEWRFTDISPLLRANFIMAEKSDGPAFRGSEFDDLVHSPDSSRLVFIDGFYRSESSFIQQNGDVVEFMSLEEAVAEKSDLIEYLTRSVSDNAFGLLNTSFLDNGTYIHVREGQILEHPIFLYYNTDSAEESIAVFPRNVIKVGDNARVKIVEIYSGKDGDTYFMNPVSNILLGENSTVDYYRVQDEGEEAFHIGIQQVFQERNSRFNSHVLSFGAAFARNEMILEMAGIGGDCTLNGLYVTGGNQHTDHHTFIRHISPSCSSRELYKGILDGQSRAVFSGKIYVDKEAQKTDAIQSNKNLLLSENAVVDTKPQLEIFADDVRCTHGGTVGQIDNNGIFYLQTRGIEERMARLLMIQAFAGEVTQTIEIKDLREAADRHINTYLGNSMEMK